MNLPISEATIFRDVIYTSGIPPSDNSNEPGNDLSFGEQVENVINNLSDLLDANGSNIRSILYIYVYLSNIEFIDQFNKIYSKKLMYPFPARKVIETKFTNPNVLVEISAIAVKAEYGNEIICTKKDTSSNNERN